MKVSYEYDQDPRYGWVRVDADISSFTFVVQDRKGETYGFQFSEGKVVPTCICHARSANECACPNHPWRGYE